MLIHLRYIATCFHSDMLWLLVLPAGLSLVDVLAFLKAAPWPTYVGVLSNVLGSDKQALLHRETDLGVDSAAQILMCSCTFKTVVDSSIVHSH